MLKVKENMKYNSVAIRTLSENIFLMLMLPPLNTWTTLFAASTVTQTLFHMSCPILGQNNMSALMSRLLYPLKVTLYRRGSMTISLRGVPLDGLNVKTKFSVRSVR